MKQKLPVILVAFIAAAAPVRAQFLPREIVDPQALRLQVADAYAGISVEAESERTKYLGFGVPQTYRRLFLGPVFGLTAAGSVYHPNFLRFTLSGELSPGYAIEKFSSGSLNDRKQVLFLGNYFANFLFLSQKPYHFNATLSQNYAYRDYDFFNRVEVNTTRYGASLGYQASRIPFAINLWRRNEQTYGQLSDSSLEETGLTLDARNTRQSGESSFNYTFTDTSRSDLNEQAGNTVHSFGLGDSETFGSNHQMLLTTNAGYTTQDSSNSPTNELFASANLSVEHSPTLSSVYDVTYSRNMSQSSVASANSANLNGSASLRHQLFESLTSTLRFQGQDFSSDGSFEDVNNQHATSRSDTARYGGSLTEQYVKRLGSFGRLTMLGAIILEHSVIDNGGATLVIVDESHGFISDSSGNGSDTFYLNLPYVDEGTIVITDNHNTFPAFQEGRDYTISHNGSSTLIRRMATSTIIQNSTVLVAYRAKASASGEYDTVTSLLNMRIDLWKGLAAVYGRICSVQNNAPEELVVQDMEVQAIGIESTWRWLHAGAEYEAHDSTFSSYRNTRFFESLCFKPEAASTLNFDLSQSQTQYVDAGRNELNYSFMTRYQRGFKHSVGLHLDAGIAVRKGEGVDQTLATVRPGLEFNLGQIAVKLGYNFEYGKFLGSEEHLKQSLFISARRVF